MLKTIDRYILGKFLNTFFFTVLIFTLISVFIDFSEKVERFINEPITWKEILFIYYPGFIVFIAEVLWPLFTLIAVVFFTSRMASNSEILAIFNAGGSFNRLLRPYIMGAGILMAVFMAGSHFFVPWISKLRLEIVHKYLDKNADKGRTANVHMFTAPGEKVFVQQFRKADSTARNFRMERFDSSGLVFLLQADQAQYLGGPPHRWKIKNFTVRTFNGSDETIFNGRSTETDTTINLHPGDFVDYAEQQAMMTTPELLRFIAQQKSRGAGNTRKYESELHTRTAEAFTVLILTLIGVAVAARKVRGGVGLHLALGVAVGAFYVVVSRFALVFATGETIPVLLGVWMPNIVFGIAALYLMQRAQQ
jgi:lipopolysaccharide export system permease protein